MLSKFEELCKTLQIDGISLSDVEIASRIYAHRKTHCLSIGDADILISAQAITRGYILATNNIKHYEGIVGLKFENWC